MDPSAAHSAYDFTIVDGDFNHTVKANALLLQCLGLGDRSRKTVEQKAVDAVGLGDALLHEVEDQSVRDEIAGLHDGFGLATDRTASLDGGT